MNCPNYEHDTDAYLSGEFESAEWRSHLDCCPNCAAKLQSETDFDLIIKHAVNEERLQTRQLEAHVRAAIRKSRKLWHMPKLPTLRYGIAATIVFGVLGLASFGYAKGRMDHSAVCSDAADDHQEEIVVKAPRKWRSDLKQVEALSQRIVGDSTVAERVTPAGYHLVGARICTLHDKDYMHLDFSDGSSEISLFIRRLDPPTLKSRLIELFSSDDSVGRVEAFSVGSAQKHDLSLVVVSSSPVPDVQKLVDQAASQL
jgi:anti-sigma factor RsiW